MKLRITLRERYRDPRLEKLLDDGDLLVPKISVPAATLSSPMSKGKAKYVSLGRPAIGVDDPPLHTRLLILLYVFIVNYWTIALDTSCFRHGGLHISGKFACLVGQRNHLRCLSNRWDKSVRSVYDIT